MTVARSAVYFDGATINPLGTGRGASDFTSLVFRLILPIHILSNFCKIGLRGVPLNLFEDRAVYVSADGLAP